MSSIEESEPRTHYHFRISLRVRHPAMDPEQITDELGTKPEHAGKVGGPRRTPKGTPLPGFYRDTYWVADMAAGRWPLKLDEAIHDVLTSLLRHRSFLHRVRAENGTAELFIGWFFENQSGDVLTHRCLALAGDLQVDLSFDVYSPEQPQHEYELSS